MVRKDRMKYIFPIGLFLAVLLDGNLSWIAAPIFFTTASSVMSLLTCLWLVMAVCFAERIERLYLWTILAGVLWDLYYTGVVGVMALILPLMVYLTRIAYEFFAPSFIVVLLIFLIDIALVTALFFMYNRMIGFTNAAFSTYVVKNLAPSLAFNLAVFIVGYFPLAKMFTKYANK